MGDDLAETLTELFHKRARGETPDFRRVVIETTGLADPGPIIGTLLADRVMTSRYAIAGVIVVADGRLGVDQLGKHREAKRQAAFADKIIISKRDLISSQEETALKTSLRAVNPRAEILSIAKGEIEPELLLARPQERVFETLPEAKACGHAHDHDGAHDHAPDHAPDHAHDHKERAQTHSKSVETVFAPFPRQMDWAKYAALIAFLQRRFGADLWRTKGILQFKGEPAPMVVQGVQHLFAPPAPLAGAKDARFGLVLIGENLGGRSLIGALEAFGASPD